MNYAIIGETIKSAISLKLGEIFDNPYRYKENITNPKYPSFWIVQVNLSETSKSVLNGSVLNSRYQNRIQLDYLMNVQYRVAENTETISNLQQRLDEVGLKLAAEFNEIDLELPTKIKNKTYEKVDGVGQFTFNVTVFATPEIEEEATMETLSQNIDVEEE